MKTAPARWLPGAGWVPDGFNLVSAFSPGDQMIAAYAAMRPHRPAPVGLSGDQR